MVFRAKSPHQVIEDVGLRKRSKLLILLLLIAFVAMGYYLITSHKQNTLLEAKIARLKSRLEKYQSGFQQCERNLKTSRSDVKNFNDANKNLQKKIVKQEAELALLEKNHLASETKLQDAFNFFLEVKELVGNDQSVSEDHEVTESVASPLKKDIEAMKISHKAHGKLKKAHKDLTERYEAAKGALSQLETEKGEADRRLTALGRDVQTVQRELNLKRSEIRKLNGSNSDLRDTVEKLKKLIKKVKLDAMKSKMEQKKSVVVVAHTPPPRAARVRNNMGGRAGVRKLPDKPEDIGPVRQSARFHGVVGEESLERRIVQHRTVRNADTNLERNLVRNLVKTNATATVTD